VAASPEYLKLARELTEKHGALLVLDEIISGFRFRAGNLGALYGIQPDLTTLGKVVGGGMPVAAVAGRADVMDLCGRQGGRRVRFDGGTYSGHPLSMLAGRTLLEYLVSHEDEVYPRIHNMGARLRDDVQAAYDDEGVLVQVLGGPSDVMPGSSMILLNFLHQEGISRDLPDEINNPLNSDGVLREREVKVAYLLEDVFVLHGGGAVSMAHTEEDLARFVTVSRSVARRLREAGLAGAHR
jgi:glutamate-1-semialdehyde 2,1-aminomutase